jgi:hypothetical protein
MKNAGFLLCFLACVSMYFSVVTGSGRESSPAGHEVRYRPVTKPNDQALREKIIRLVRDMKPPAAIPEEANRAFAEP